MYATDDDSFLNWCSSLLCAIHNSEWNVFVGSHEGAQKGLLEQKNFPFARQILIELHPKILLQTRRFFELMRNQGYVITHKEPNTRKFLAGGNFLRTPFLIFGIQNDRQSCLWHRWYLNHIGSRQHSLTVCKSVVAILLYFIDCSQITHMLHDNRPRRSPDGVRVPQSGYVIAVASISTTADSINLLRSSHSAQRSAPRSKNITRTFYHHRVTRLNGLNMLRTCISKCLPAVVSSSGKTLQDIPLEGSW